MINLSNKRSCMIIDDEEGEMGNTTEDSGENTVSKI